MKSILEQRKIIRNNDKIIIGAFIGGIIMTVVFTILSWTPTTKFKDIAPVILSSITILIGLFTAVKVLKWNEVKRNDKGFEVAQNIVMKTYESLMIISKMEKLIAGAADRFKNKKIEDGDLGFIANFLKEISNEFITKQYEINTASMSLKKWNITSKKVIEEPIIKISVHYEFLVNSLIKIRNGEVNTHAGIKEIHKEVIERFFALDEIIKEYNKFSIDDLYEFNN
ncbi:MULTISPECIES: hypothetical protein [unclassified Tatumella]|uniref:hypothetical protein n=1 Tax=unclassified Tatumella TaxID=2649542 RepID=UPI001BB00F5A|nr:MULTISPECIES: hypothetical protein [unclassified Tatumella]MBS0878874.1 hypothetical protein [Tatumella sp. JGM82]MBS0892399.1 hypothetical protein [Tatumella sp. JGM94]